jgi:DNA-binding winged helix-turn-helix (wHTH) protein/tetratricopeptide (TPR) repeat protein
MSDLFPLGPLISFDDFEMDLPRFELRRSGQQVRVERRVFDLIAYLLKHRDRVVSKDEILRNLWHGRSVSDASVGVAISAARRALDDDPGRQARIRTVHGRGYQFVAAMSPHATLRSPTLAKSSGFVGRTDEIKALEQTLTSTDGHCRIILIRGTPGIGKSRLLEYLATLAAHHRFLVCSAHCIEGDGAPTFSAWTQLLRQVLSTTPPSLMDSIAIQHRQAISMLLPELSDSPQPSVRFDYSPRTTDQYRLFDSVTVLLESVLRTLPLALLIDDIHRADHPSLELAHFLARELRNCPLLLAFTLRDPELAAQPSRSVVLNHLICDTETLDVTLHGLSPVDTAALLTQLVGTQPAQEVCGLVYDKTAGNPFFVKQLASIVPRLAPHLGQPSLPPLPRGLREAILHQLDSLEPSIRRLLAVAAVAGRDFEPRVLELCTGLPRAELAATLSQAVAAGVLRKKSSRLGWYSFDHVLVRDALYDGFPSHERSRVHYSIGSAIEQEHSASLDAYVAELAHHYFEGAPFGGAEKGLEYCLNAADAAAAQFAHDEAATLYGRALKLLGLLNPTDHSRRARLLLRLGSAQLHAGDRAAAQSSFRTAARLARRLGAAEELADAALGISEGFFAIEAGNVDFFLIDLLEEAMDMLEGRDPAREARLLARLAMALHWSDHERRVTLSRHAWEIAQQTKDEEVSLYVLHARWLAEWSRENFDERLSIAETLVERAERLKQPGLLLICRLFLLVSLLERGEIDAFDRQFALFRHLVLELRQPHTLWYPPMLASMRALMEGRFSEAPKLISKLAAAAARVQDANALHSLMAHNLTLRFERGGLEGLVDGVRHATARYPSMAGWRAALAWILCRTGSLAEARIQFELIAARDFSCVSEQYDWPAAIALATEACWILGDAQRAGVLYELLAPLADRFLLIGLGVVNWGSAERSLGLLAMTMREFDVADRHFSNAIERNAAVHARPWVVHARLDRAELLADGGREKDAAGCVGQALEEASCLGMSQAMLRGDAIAQRLRRGRCRRTRILK